MSEFEEDPDNAEIESRLKQRSSKEWLDLWDAVDRLPPAERIASRGGGEVDDHLADGTPVFQMPYPIYDEQVDRMVHLLYDLRVVTSFGWSEWYQEGVYPGGRGMESAPAADAIRLLTVFVRAERFSDGAIETGFRDGSIPAALARLRRWWAEKAETSIEVAADEPATHQELGDV